MLECHSLQSRKKALSSPTAVEWQPEKALACVRIGQKDDGVGDDGGEKTRQKREAGTW